MKKNISWEKKKNRIGLYFVLPFAIGSIFFILIPVFKSLAYSFCELSVTATGYTLTFKGLENYHRLFFIDPNYRKVLLNSLKDMLINVPVTVLFSFFIASLLNQNFRGRTLVRGILFLPVIISSGIYLQLNSGDLVSSMISSGTKGSASAEPISTAFVSFLSQLKLATGLTNILLDSVNRISTIVSMSAIPIIIFLAGFQAISPSIFEAAHVEGASKWDVFWKIDFPMVTPLILVSVIYTMVDSFTNTSNSMINSVHSTMFYNFKFGLGSAMVWVYLAVIFIILAIVYAIINRFIFYYD